MTIRESSSESVVKSDGPVVAALLALGLGSVAYGILVIIPEFSASFKTFLTLNESVGPLSGKTIFAIVIWLVVWVVLHQVFTKKSFELAKAYTWSLIMVGLGLLFTFPTFFLAFAKG